MRAAGEATVRLREAEALLPDGAYAYERGRMRLARVQALTLAGDGPAAEQLLDEVIASARQAECLGLLADALRERAALNLAPEPRAARKGEPR